jgi:DNA-binding IclR family transcriptional regulator
LWYQYAANGCGFLYFGIAGKLYSSPDRGIAMREPNRDTRVKAVEKMDSILDAIVDREGATAEELSSQLEIPLSTIFDHLYTMEAIGYVVKSDGAYHPASQLLKLGDDYRHSKPVFVHSKSHLNWLSEETGRHASLMVEENGQGVYIYTAEASGSGPLIGTLGQKTKLHASAPGKAILAHMSPEWRDETIERHGLPGFTDNTITTEEAVRTELSEIRTKGYAIDREEGLEGLEGIGVPIIDRSSGQLLGAISSYTVASGEVEPNDEGFRNEIQEARNRIELNLAYNP